MACLLIVDDDSDNASQLCSAVCSLSAGTHTAFNVKDLGEFRRFRRQRTADLIVVELQRLQSNGFTLAAALARLNSAPVLLLTDRDQRSDHIWAAARGITGVVSRRDAGRILIRQLDSLSSGSGLVLTTDKPAAALRPAPDPAVIESWRKPPRAALLRCVVEELQHRSTVAEIHSLEWVTHILPYVNEPGITAQLATLACGRHGEQTQAWLPLREHVQMLLQTPASEMLLGLCEDNWSTLRGCLSQESGDLHAAKNQCSRLLQALAFVQTSSAGSHVMPADADHELPWLVEQIERHLACARQCSPLSQLQHNICSRALAAVCASDRGSEERAWRELASFALIRHAISPRSASYTLARDCLLLLFDRPRSPQSQVLQRVLRQLLLMIGGIDVGGANSEREPDLQADSASQLTLSVDVTRKLQRTLQQTASALQRLLAQLSAPITGYHPLLHQRLSLLMVSIYKLRSFLDFSCADTRSGDDSHQQWRLALACLYSCICHGVRQTDVLTPTDFRALADFVRQLCELADRGMVPSAVILMKLAALELTLQQRLSAGSELEHQLLAAGLHLLPQPERIVAEWLNEVRQSGTVLIEITHELMLLTEGAQKLGVVRVESLARLMLDCYQQLVERPELLRRKAVRLALVRAHRALCRLLDQAAAWLPLDQSGGGPVLSAVIDGLFIQFAPASHVSDTEAGAAGSSVTDPTKIAWVQCQSLNRRLRQLLRRADNFSGYGSLMTELLNQQQAVMAPYLPYQRHE